VNRYSPWQPNSSAWIGWLQKSYRSAAFSSQLANVPILSQKLNSIGTECDESILNIPVAVMSQPHDLERRNHTLRLLNTVGFRNVSFSRDTEVVRHQHRADDCPWCFVDFFVLIWSECNFTMGLADITTLTLKMTPRVWKQDIFFAPDTALYTHTVH
jgi:hypothetical protein